MNAFKKFVKSTGVYLLGTVLTKLASFLMLPLYTVYLSPTEYGNFDLYTAYVSFLCSILFLDIWCGVMRFMFDYDTDEGRAKPVTVGALIFLTSSVMYTICVFVLGTAMDIPYKGLLVLYGLSMNLAQYVGYVARTLGKNIIYAVGGLVGTLVTILLNILFIAVQGKGYAYLYVAYVIGHLVNVLIVSVDARIWRYVKARYFDKGVLKDLLRFSAPLPINSAAYWFLSSYNRVVISGQLSAAENGIYAIANKFGNMVNLVTQCFQMAWQEMSFSKRGDSQEELDQFYTTAFNEYTRFMWLGTLILIPCVKVIFPIMIGSDYATAESIVPGALLAALFTCISTFLGSIISAIKRNNLIFTTTGLGAVVNVVLINILIHVIGVQAANIALSAGFGVACITRILLLRKYLKIRPNFKWIGLLAAGTVVVFLVYLEANRIINALLVVLLAGICLLVYRKQIYHILDMFLKKR